MTPLPRLKTALVHHWLVTRRGGERVLEGLAELFPHADLFTLVADRERMPDALRDRRLVTSFLQRLPRPTRLYPYYLPLFPLATERLNLSGYELVITSDAATVKGVRADPAATHICYCHTPMRYVWSAYEDYARAAAPLARLAFAPLAQWLRRWDRRAAQRVTHFVANSRNVSARIRRYYGRESAVVYPPVDTERFVPGAPSSADFFLVVSQLVPYKRVDVAVEAFNRSGKPLVVIGEGSEGAKLQRAARANVRFLGAQPDAAVVCALQTCRALVFPGEEDFGIVMAEAQACGKPVIALGRGGALEIVSDPATGLFFEEPTADALLAALEHFETLRFDPATLRASALGFSRDRFGRDFSDFVRSILSSRLEEPTLVAPSHG